MTRQSLARILAQCLEEAERTGDSVAVLQAHPEHAVEVRPFLELATLARRLYANVPTPPRGLAWGRELMLSHAGASQVTALG